MFTKITYIHVCTISGGSQATPLPNPTNTRSSHMDSRFKKKKVLFHKGQKQTLNFLYLGIERFLKSSEDTQE